MIKVSPESQDTSQTMQEFMLSVQSARLGYRLNTGFHLAVADVSFDVSPGESITLIGPSGCGKSTLLKSIAGFHPMESGRVQFNGRECPLPGPDRAVVFQEFDQLFPWRTVLGNVQYPLRRNGWSKVASRETAQQYLKMMGLESAAERYPHQLSGGMKQRTAIARALALSPDMLLMDEPFGSLDAITRTRLQLELAAILDETNVTLLFVTHSIAEAVILGDRVVVLSSPPSTVREILTVSHEAKEIDSHEHNRVLKHLRALLELTGEELNNEG